MGGGALTIRRSIALLAGFVLLLVGAGCGDGSSNDGITVQTGSLSKAEFIEKADAICKAGQAEFVANFTQFSKVHQAELNDPAKKEKLLNEIVESLIDPTIEEDIERISGLGAPNSYAPQVTKFLTALQARLDEAHEDPSGLVIQHAWKKATDVAKAVGMKGCSESFG